MGLKRSFPRSDRILANLDGMVEFGLGLRPAKLRRDQGTVFALFFFRHGHFFEDTMLHDVQLFFARHQGRKGYKAIRLGDLKVHNLRHPLHDKVGIILSLIKVPVSPMKFQESLAISRAIEVRLVFSSFWGIHR